MEKGMCRHYALKLMKEDRHFIKASHHNNCVLCLVDAKPDGMTQAEIAKYMGLSKMRVCQIEHQALAKLDKKMKKALQIPTSSV